MPECVRVISSPSCSNLCKPESLGSSKIFFCYLSKYIFSIFLPKYQLNLFTFLHFPKMSPNCSTLSQYNLMYLEQTVKSFWDINVIISHPWLKYPQSSSLHTTKIKFIKWLALGPNQPYIVFSHHSTSSHVLSIWLFWYHKAFLLIHFSSPFNL